MTETIRSAELEVCPYLGVAGDAASHYAFPSGAQRCHAGRTPVGIDLAKQARDCLTAAHVTCPRYHPPPVAPPRRVPEPASAPGALLERVQPGAPDPGVDRAGIRSGTRGLLWLAVLAFLLVIASVAGLILGGGLAALPGNAPAGEVLSEGSSLAPVVPPATNGPTGPVAPTTAPQASPSSSSVPTPSPTAPATPGPSASSAPTPAPQVHTVVRGETLTAIARRYGVSVEALKAANRSRYPTVISNPNLIYAGQELVIPVT